MMLPGVEFARRRRVRAGQGRDLDAYDGGVNRSGMHRSRSGQSVAHRHHHQHIFHQRLSNPPRPGTPPRPPSLVRRMQDILQEYRSNNSAIAPVCNGGSSSGRVDGESSTYSGHGFRHRSGEESRGAQLSFFWRRHSAGNHTDPREAAKEARDRLDERLCAAAHATNSLRRNNWTAVQSTQAELNTVLSDSEEEGNAWGEDDSWESVHEWLLSAEDRYRRVEYASSRSTSGNSSSPLNPQTSEGLSKSVIKYLPREVVGVKKPEQQDCPVCLEDILPGQTTISLPCNHRFHPECLTPWLSIHAQCPYCRADVPKGKSIPDLKSRRTMRRNEDLMHWAEAVKFLVLG